MSKNKQGITPKLTMRTAYIDQEPIIPPGAPLTRTLSVGIKVHHNGLTNMSEVRDLTGQTDQVQLVRVNVQRIYDPVDINEAIYYLDIF